MNNLMVIYHLNAQNLFVTLICLKEDNEETVLQRGDLVYFNFTAAPFDINRY